MIESISAMVERYKFLPHISSFLSNILSPFLEKGSQKRAGASKEDGDDQGEKLCGRACFERGRFLLTGKRKVMRQTRKVLRQTIMATADHASDHYSDLRANRRQQRRGSLHQRAPACRRDLAKRKGGRCVKIVNLDPHNAATVDQRAYEQFCAHLGIPQNALETLEVRFVLTIPGKPHAGAEFQGKKGASLIRVRTQDNQQRRYSVRQLTKYLLHETKHFCDYCATGRCYAPEDVRLPHDARPAELMARAFAAQHQQWRLIQFERALHAKE